MSKTKILRLSAVASVGVQVSAQKSPVVVTALILKSTRYDKDFVSGQ